MPEKGSRSPFSRIDLPVFASLTSTGLVPAPVTTGVPSQKCVSFSLSAVVASSSPIIVVCGMEPRLSRLAEPVSPSRPRSLEARGRRPHQGNLTSFSLPSSLIVTPSIVVRAMIFVGVVGNIGVPSLAAAAPSRVSQRSFGPAPAPGRLDSKADRPSEASDARSGGTLALIPHAPRDPQWWLWMRALSPRGKKLATVALRYFAAIGGVSNGWATSRVGPRLAKQIRRLLARRTPATQSARPASRTRAGRGRAYQHRNLRRPDAQIYRVLLEQVEKLNEQGAGWPDVVNPAARPALPSPSG